MGTNTKSEDNHNRLWERLPELGTAEFASLSDRLTDVLKEVGFEPPQGRYAKYAQLTQALNAFADKRDLWLQGEPASRLTLQQHLAFTLIVPAGKASRGREAVMRLTRRGTIPYYGQCGDALEQQILVQTREYVRFPNQKAKRIAAALKDWDAKVTRILELLKEPGRSISAVRADIMALFEGYGPKAAAHFMRNTGIMGGYNALPIIDTHIMKLIDALGFGIDPNRGSYSQYEQHFARLARLTGIPPLLLDAVVWCAYANNWELSGADFDNFKTEQQETGN